MVETVLKWAATGKRLTNECEGAERKLALVLTREQEVSRDFQILEKARADHRAFVVKQVFWFRSALDQIRIKMEEKLGFNERQAKLALQNLLETFEAKLASFKLTMRGEFDRLESDEAQLSLELEPLLSNLEMYSQPSGIDVEHEREQVAVSQAEIRQKALLRLNEDVAHKAAIGEVDRELATIGRTGDWDTRDHDAFIRVWNSILASVEVVHRVLHREDADTSRDAEAEETHVHAGPESDIPSSPERHHANVAFQVQLSAAHRAQLLKKMEFHVLGKTKEELEQHIDWYSRVLELTAKKKQLLSEWRRNQTQRRKSLLEKVEKEEEAEHNGEANLDDIDEEALAKEEIRIKRQEEQRLSAQQRAAKWRADKKLQEEREKAERQSQLEKEQKDAADDRKRRQGMMQAQLAAWKDTKQHKDEPQHVSPRKTDPAELRRRQERDLELAKQRKEKASLQALKKTERDQRVNEALQFANEPHVERDPARLLAGTKAYEAGKVHGEDLDAADHRRATSGAHSKPIAMTGRDLQFSGRAKPAWMRPPV